MSDAATGSARVGTELAGRWVEHAVGQAVRTPLHSVLGFLELLAMSGLDADQRRLHEQLVDSAEHLLAGSDRLLWLARVLSGSYRPRPARVHLAAFAAEIADATSAPVTDVVGLDAPPHLTADLAALHQLVVEMVANATMHGRAPVVLAITAAGDRRDAVRITVSDAGSGLPPAAREALFGVAPLVDRPAGLGLPLIRGLVDLLGAILEVAPSPMGTHLRVTLPLEAAALPAPVPVDTPVAAGPPSPATGARPLRVLLVEDNATNRLLTQRQLDRLGHTLVAVATGSAGVEAALREDPDHAVDVVLMDRHLPDVDGCEAARRILAGLPPGRPPLPVIAVTADATSDAREACTAAGMSEVLTKPVDLRHLADALARAAATIDRGAGATPPPPAGTALQPAVLQSVLRRVDGDPAAAAELLQAYLGELPGRRLRIQAGLRRDDPRAVRAAAESLRTSSESVGASAVATACAAVGAAAAQADLAAARTFLPALSRECEQVAAELAAYTEPARIAAVVPGC